MADDDYDELDLADGDRPTTPAPFAALDFALLAADAPLPPARVDWILPADFVPILRVSRAALSWQRLSPLALQVLLRVDGAASTAELLGGLDDPAADVLRELRELVQRGLVGFRADVRALTRPEVELRDRVDGVLGT
jgi:hypothetical protein